MTPRGLSFAVNVDLSNPGQAVACCGLLELSHRLWPGAEGWFGSSSFHVAAPLGEREGGLASLVSELAQCSISGLTGEQEQELKQLEQTKRQESLSEAEERRRKELGGLARKGRVMLGPPFGLPLDWWSDEATPKTWAGRQELVRIARAAQRSLGTLEPSQLESLLDYARVLLAEGDNKKVEPFYFDARRFIHALDAGFSPDEQKMVTPAHPAVELLALVGLQRFRFHVGLGRTLSYRPWPVPLTVAVAPAAFCAVIPMDASVYEFRLRFRDDRKRYKAFGIAHPRGGNE